jgi:uncharacterized protein
MSLILTAVVCLIMVRTAFLSGIFGMAGGLALIGVLLVILPVPDAIMLHGVTQMARTAGAGCCGSSTYAGARRAPIWPGARWRSCWGFFRYVPSKAVALFMLGGAPLRMSDIQFRRWSNRIVTGLSGYFVAYGCYVLAVSGL